MYYFSCHPCVAPLSTSTFPNPWIDSVHIWYGDRQWYNPHPWPEGQGHRLWSLQFLRHHFQTNVFDQQYQVTWIMPNQLSSNPSNVMSFSNTEYHISPNNAKLGIIYPSIKWTTKMTQLTVNLLLLLSSLVLLYLFLIIYLFTYLFI